jgi:SPP1 family holin
MIIMNLKKVSKETWIRTIILVVSLVNIALREFGIDTLPFTPEEFGEGFSAVFAIVMSIVTWWKNNSFTQPAQYADEIMKGEK